MYAMLLVFIKLVTRQKIIVQLEVLQLFLLQLFYCMKSLIIGFWNLHRQVGYSCCSYLWRLYSLKGKSVTTPRVFAYFSASTFCCQTSFSTTIFGKTSQLCIAICRLTYKCTCTEVCAVWKGTPFLHGSKDVYTGHHTAISKQVEYCILHTLKCIPRPKGIVGL